MRKNTNLHQAKKGKNDEFYTQLTDIEKELCHYRHHFVGKVVLCNCDDARESNFFKFFSMKFEEWGLKQLICIGFKADDKGVIYVYEGDKNGNKVVDDDEISVIEMEGDGDFRSVESIEVLKRADIVVTNPPFSLFREYIAQLVEYGKKFLVIGNVNAITYKEIFPLIKENKLWCGYKFNGSPMKFRVPSDYEVKGTVIDKDENGNILIGVGGTCWFTNLDHDKRHEPIVLYKKYIPEEYPKYDNYDVINVDKSADIPCDYDGVMGVPITFLDKYNPEQFEILGIANSARWINYECLTIINGKKIYNRILIRQIKK